MNKCEYWRGSTQASILNASCDEEATNKFHDRSICKKHLIEIKKRSRSKLK